MKKTIILFFILGAFATVHAQSSKDQARKVILGQPKKTVSSQQGRTVVLRGSPHTAQNRKIYKTNHTYYHKANPGKHLGWYKGVGNPHRNGGAPGKGKKG